MEATMRARPGVVSLLAFSAVSLAVVGTPSAQAGVVPTQWIAKQYTELLGRVPTTDEWNTQVAYYQAQPTCNTNTLAVLGSALAKGGEFANLYPGDKPARIIALVRAVYNHEPNMNDWAAYYTPYAQGTQTWNQIVDAIFFNGVFATYLVAQICDANEPNYRFNWSPFFPALDVNLLAGGAASRSQTQLQQELDAAAAPVCGSVALAQREIVRVGGPTNGNQQLRVPPCVTLTTTGAPSVQQYARMGRIVPAGDVCYGFDCGQGAIVHLGEGADLRSVWVDGNGSDAGLSFKVANVDTDGSTSANPGAIVGCRLTDPGRGGAAIRMHGWSTNARVCEAQEVIANVITGYARAHSQDRSGRAEWADGIQVFCEQATVAGNMVVDVGDTGIVIHGVRNGYFTLPQRSGVFWNYLLSAGTSAHVALGADGIGERVETTASGGTVFVASLNDSLERSFVGSRVTTNLFWTGPRTHFDVALLVGGRTWWGDHGSPSRGMMFDANTTGSASARVNVGIAVSGVDEAVVYGNTGAPGAAGSFALVDSIGDASGDLAGCAPHAVAASMLPGTSLSGTPQPYTLTALHGCAFEHPPVGGFEPVQVSGDYFTGSVTGKRFTPLGHNYVSDDLEPLLFSDFAGLVADLRELKQIGTNVIRIHLQLHEFMNAPAVHGATPTPKPAEFDQLERLADVAAKIGVYLDVTGLSIAHQGDEPQPWYDDRTRAQRWDAQAAFWGEVARRLSGKSSVLMYDLMNEPVVFQSVTHPNWYTGFLGTPPDETYWVQLISREATTPSTRTSVSRAWIQALSTAIRAYDTVHPITVGALPNSYVGTGFSPQDVGDLLDVISVHEYPKHDIPETQADETQASVNNTRLFKQADTPLVVEETFPCFNAATDVDVERYIFGSSTLANGSVAAVGWIGHAGRETPAQGSGGICWAIWEAMFPRIGRFLAPCPNCQPY
jgi:hypothetical protein